MTIRLNILAFLIFSLCQFSKQAKISQYSHVSISRLFLNNERTNNSDTLQIICDSIYKAKNYRITLITFDKNNEDETVFNSVFILAKLINGKYKTIYSDSIYSRISEVKFKDYNNDKVKDILIQNYSDVRSNLTYYLYLVDTKTDKLKKIRGFEEIKNPNYLPQYNLIDNYVLSGRIWTSFYKIKGARIKDFGIEIYDNQTEDGSYERAYRKAINKILRIEKNNR